MTVAIRLMNIVYTNVMEESVAFYEKLGLVRKDDGDVDTWWNEFPIGTAAIALHWHQDQPLPTESNPELHLQVGSTDFETIHTEMAVHHPSAISELEGIGRLFTVVDPNGVRVQVNEE